MVNKISCGTNYCFLIYEDILYRINFLQNKNNNISILNHPSNKFTWVDVVCQYSDVLLLDSNGDLYYFDNSSDINNFYDVLFLIPKQNNFNWNKMSLGSNYSLSCAINSNGEAYTWRDVTDLNLVSQYNNKKWVLVSCGFQHIALLNENNDLCVLGTFYKDIPTKYIENATTPVLLFNNIVYKWAHISSGDDVIYMVNSFGGLFIIGSTIYTANGEYVQIPNSKAVNVISNNNFTALCVTDDNKLYGLGFNNNNLLLKGSLPSKLLTSTLIDFKFKNGLFALSDNIGVYMDTDNNNLYTWGMLDTITKNIINYFSLDIMKKNAVTLSQNKVSLNNLLTLVEIKKPDNINKNIVTTQSKDDNKKKIINNATYLGFTKIQFYTLIMMIIIFYLLYKYNINHI
jgi:hypothetical protein